MHQHLSVIFITLMYQIIKEWRCIASAIDWSSSYRVIEERDNVPPPDWWGRKFRIIPDINSIECSRKYESEQRLVWINHGELNNATRRLSARHAHDRQLVPAQTAGYSSINKQTKNPCQRVHIIINNQKKTKNMFVVHKHRDRDLAKNECRCLNHATSWARVSPPVIHHSRHLILVRHVKRIDDAQRAKNEKWKDVGNQTLDGNSTLLRSSAVG